MANFTKINEGFLPTDSDWYKVTGQLTEEDLQQINSLHRKTTLIIDNTHGLSSNLIKKITSQNITFSVLGGLDYFSKEKYKNQAYVQRTLMSPTGLAEVIQYYESIEAHYSPEWTDTQKCMFLYDAIVKDFTYAENYDTQIERGIAERSLNGILYKKLVCSGFALAFKEGLDRIQIPNIYQNQKNQHSWNIVELDHQLRGLEITWECYNKGADNTCQFRYFGQDPDFYSRKLHSLSHEVADSWNSRKDAPTTTVYEEETEYPLTPFTIEELKNNYRTISPAINRRTVNQSPLFASKEEEMKMPPIDILRTNYLNQSKSELYYILLYQFLSSNSEINTSFAFLNIRKAYTFDLLGSLAGSLTSTNTTTFTGKHINIESLANCEFSSNGDYHAPFGTKRTIANIEHIHDQQAKNTAFAKLTSRLTNYALTFLTNILNNTDLLLSTHQQLQNLPVEKDFNLSIVEADIYTKLQSLIAAQDFLISSGIPALSLNERIHQIEDYFNSLNQKYTVTTQEQIEKDIDYLNAIFGDINEVRRICEQHEQHPFSEEEWLQKQRNAQYMMQIFDTLDIKEEHVQIALNNIFNNTETLTETPKF